MLLDRDFTNAGILIVDDQEPNVLLLRRVLSDAGYVNVSSTMVSSEVRAMHRAFHYDLILVDLQMPGIDGFEVMAQLRDEAMDPYLPVIVLTAQPAHKLRALLAGAKDFISKPFDLLEVKTRIRNMLEVRLLYKLLAESHAVLEQRVRERTAQLEASELRFRRLTELASDWYWEQNESGDYTQVSGPVMEMIGMGMPAFLGEGHSTQGTGWNEVERNALRARISERQPFLDFGFSRINEDGSTQQFRVSGEPMFDDACRFTGYRGVGVEVTPLRPLTVAIDA